MNRGVDRHLEGLARCCGTRSIARGRWPPCFRSPGKVAPPGPLSCPILHKPPRTYSWLIGWLVGLTGKGRRGRGPHYFGRYNQRIETLLATLYSSRKRKATPYEFGVPVAWKPEIQFGILNLTQLKWNLFVQIIYTLILLFLNPMSPFHFHVSIIDPTAPDFPASAQSDAPRSLHSSSQHPPLGLPSKAPRTGRLPP